MYKKILDDYAKYLEADILTIKYNLKRLRNEKNIKRSYFTAELGINANTVGTFTNTTNKSRPEFMTIILIAEHFGLDIDYFLEPINEDGDDDEQ